MGVDDIFDLFREIQMPDADRWALGTADGRMRYCGEWGELAEQSEKLVNEIDILRRSHDVRAVNDLLSRIRSHAEECRKLGEAAYMSWNNGVPRTNGFFKFMLAELISAFAPQAFKQTRRELGVSEKDFRVHRGAERQWELEEERAELLEEIDQL